jgi:hypothetical protein
MTRGNQRDKAREKNLKEQAGAVSFCLVAEGIVHAGCPSVACVHGSFRSAWHADAICNGTTNPVRLTEEEEHAIRHRIREDEGAAGSHHARETGKRWVVGLYPGRRF